MVWCREYTEIYFMNAPTHFVASTVLTFGFLKIFSFRTSLNRKRLAWCGLLSVLASVGAHLLLDIAPHYAWIYYLDKITSWEQDWMVRESIFSLMVVLPCLYWAAPYRGLLCLVMLAGIYPDIEKVLKLNYYLMADEVLFPVHSHMGSSNDYGWWKPGLIAAELILVGVLMVLAYRWSPRGRAANHSPASPTI